MSEPKPFTFICGADDFLVGRLGKEAFAKLAEDVPDEFSREVINGFAAKVDEVTSAVNQFRDAVQTMPMFGGKRAIWFKDVNFLADTVTGRSETTLRQVEALQDLLGTLNPTEVAVLITASPVDRRRAFPKWCEKTAEFTLVASGGANDSVEALAGVVLAEARAVGVEFSGDALQLLLARVGANTRLLVEEVHKLSNSLNDGETQITEALVADLTPNVAEGDFFETSEAFFKGDLNWTLRALAHHFFSGGDSRPVISALQNRNRILIQLRALIDAGQVQLGSRGVSKSDLERAAGVYGHHFVGVTEKSAFNVFTQNPWYLGKLAGDIRHLPTLKRLITNQREFINAFAEIIRRPNEQEEVLRDMAVRCLT